MFKKILTMAILCLIFAGCNKDEGLHFKLRYDKIQGLKQDARVLFEGNHIGDVSSVVYGQDGRYLLDVTIQKEFANAATAHSEFFIIRDPRKITTKAVEIVQTRKGGTSLKEGAVVDGSARSSAILDSLKDKIGKGVEEFTEEFTDQFDNFMKELSSISESEAIKKLEKKMELLMGSMEKSGKSVQDKVQKEILPRVEQEIDKLRERLRKLGQEEYLKKLEEKINQLRNM
ncbi:MAG: hypothetical protein B6245_22190 [Desulfobacteraceae bacterium 4572_88]|nr:MAG: hypothetical protein B6245_22190 [Desulfobacteraceae bacterium 4572_88]